MQSFQQLNVLFRIFHWKLVMFLKVVIYVAYHFEFVFNRCHSHFLLDVSRRTAVLLAVSNR